MANIDAKVTVDTAQAQREINSLSQRLDKLSTDFETSFSRLQTAGLAIAGVLGGIATATAMWADGIQDIADANEVAAGEVIALSKALEAAGGQADKTGLLFAVLARNIEDANGGNLKLAESFGKLGISVQDLGTLSASEIRDKLLQSLSQIPDAAERNARAMEFFGKSVQGVDIRALTEGLQRNAGAYDDAGRSVKAFADLVGNLEKIMGNVKLAFAEAFGPLAARLANVKISAEALTVVFQALAAAMVAAFGVAMLNRVIKLINLVGTLNQTVKKNPLLFAAGAALSLMGAAGTYTALEELKEESKLQDDLATKKKAGAEEERKIRRDQSGYNEARKKQAEQEARERERALDLARKLREQAARELASLQKVGETLQRNYQDRLDSLDLEREALSLSQDQQQIAKETADIRARAETAILNLRQTYNALGEESRAKFLDVYKAEEEAIRRNTNIQIDAIRERLRGYQQFKEVLRDINSAGQIYLDTEIKLAENAARFTQNLAGLEGAIAIEQGIIAQQKLRLVLSERLARVSEDQQRAASAAIEEVLANTDLITGSASDFAIALEDAVRNYQKIGDITEETARILTGNLGFQITAIKSTQEALTRQAQAFSKSQREFSYGWKKAFKEYADNATNAARVAERVFGRAIQGLEDLLVDFVKTGKFEWKNFVSMMLEELLRAQIQQTFAQIFNPNNFQTGKSGGGSLIDNILGGIGSLFGTGNTRGNSPGTPLYVMDISGGGGTGGFGFSTPGQQQQGGGILGTLGSIGKTIGNVIGGVTGGVGKAISGVVNTVSTIGKAIGGSGIGQAIGSVIDWGKNLFSGFFANGGMIPAGRFGIVGERGPEYVGGPAQVTPMPAQQVVYNINAVDAASFRQLIARDPGFIHAVAQQGARSVPQARS